VLPPNLGGQAERAGFGEVLAGRAEAPFSLRGDVGLLLCGHCPGAEHQAATDQQSVFHKSSSLHTRFILLELTQGSLVSSREEPNIPPYFV
jgi:hypothetical protein